MTRLCLWLNGFPNTRAAEAIGLSTAVLLFVFLTVLSIEHVGMK